MDHRFGCNESYDKFVEIVFVLYTPCVGNRKIKIVDGSLSTIAGKGSITISSSSTLHNVLHVPNLSCNLLSVSQLTQDQNCRAYFLPSHCEFQDLKLGRTIGSAKQSGGLYFHEDGSDLRKQSQRTCFESISISLDNEIMLWHFRLGHPNFQYLKYLIPCLFKNQDSSLFQCDICELSKHHRASFPLQPYKSTKPFSVIHNDVWGPSSDNTIMGKRWFVTFIDDHIRILLGTSVKDKLEVEQVFEFEDAGIFPWR